jgi:hypothetical protein
MIHEARSIALEHGINDVVFIDPEHVGTFALLQGKVVPDISDLP